MQPVRIIFANQLVHLPVVQATVNGFVLASGGTLSIARQMELVVEEMVTNIIKFEYLPGQQEQIELELSVDNRQLAMSLKFKGIPFDISHLQRCGEVSKELLFSGEVRGIGLHLVQQCIDKLEYLNLGKEGQQIVMLRNLGREEASPVTQLSSDPAAEQTLQPVNSVIRRMLPDEAAAVSKLAYFAYNYTYIYDHIYDPEKVASLNRDGLMTSFVAADQAKGEIIGHCALLPDQQTGLYEMGIAFVNPLCRGGGTLNNLSEYMMREAQDAGSEGIFVLAVTSHIYSQKVAVRYDLRETAILLSRVQPIDMRNIHDHAVFRESLVFMVRLFKETERGLYHPPHRHRNILAEICRHLGGIARFSDTGGLYSLPEHGTVLQELDSYNAGHIRVKEFGKDTGAVVRQMLHDWCLERLESIYLYLPLKQPATADMTASFEDMGFFFSGFLPGNDGNDLLLLQYLNNQRYNYDALHLATEFGQRLLEYIKGCDPVILWEKNHGFQCH